MKLLQTFALVLLLAHWLLPVTAVTQHPYAEQQPASAVVDGWTDPVGAGDTPDDGWTDPVGA